MRQPYSYYGGKQRLAPEILPLIPPHTQYVCAFLGGGTIFWNKKPSKNEVLNDLDGRITNFYMQLKTNFHELQKLIHGTLHSEVLHTKAGEMLDDPNETPLNRAWALWVQCNMSFSYQIFGGFAFGTTGVGFGSANKRDRFTEELSRRLRDVEIFQRDALDLIDLKDHEETVFYLDPPYASSDCGHYKGYTLEDFERLLIKLKTIKGKFILSSYPEEILLKYREECGWKSKDIHQIVSVNGKREGTKYKTECITYNFLPPNNQAGLFDDAQPQFDVQCDENGEPVYLGDSIPDKIMDDNHIRDGESPTEAAERLFREEDERERNKPIFTEDEINNTDGQD